MAPGAGYERKKGLGNCQGPFGFVGGEEEDRTPDLRIANATLSQLSYDPKLKEFKTETLYKYFRNHIMYFLEMLAQH